MSYSLAVPAPPLRSYIERYWLLRATYVQPETITLLPDGGAHLLVNLGAGARSNRFGSCMESERFHLVGAMLRSDQQVLQGEQHIIGVTFKPGGFPCFHRWDAMRAATDRVQPVAHSLPIDDGDLAALAPRLDRHFLDRLRPPRNSLLGVLDDIHSSAGLLRVDTLLKRHALTGRTLERQFQEQIGITPKELLALTRFKRAQRMLERRSKSLMEIAWDCGYYDHAHLTREYKRFTGSSPTRLLLSDLSKDASG